MLLHSRNKFLTTSAKLLRLSSMSKWTRRKLNELGEVGRGRSRHRPRNDPALYGGIYPFFQTGDVTSEELYLHEFSQTYNERGLAQSKLWPAETLCITIAANIAENAILKISGCFPDSVVGFSAFPKEANSKFVKYMLDHVKWKMQMISKGTTQDNLSLEKLLSIDFLVPDLETQEEIASILSAYDDLIENNARRIAVLEEMARRIYEEWFVYFRAPGCETLPRMNTPLGPAPEGWVVVKLGDILDLKYGKALKADERNGGPFPVYGSSGVVGQHSEPLVDRPGIIVGRKGNVGSIHWSPKPFYPIDTAFFVESELPIEFLFHVLKKQRFLNSDAAVPGLNRAQAHSIEIIFSGSTLSQQFADLVRPMFGLAQTLSEQNRNLRTQRDLLLPKLISGEIDVSEASAFLEAAE